MDFNYLSIHHDELLTFLRANDYAETYVNRYKTTIKQITANAVDQKWASYEDVYQWYVDAGYSATYLHELHAILGKLELFHTYGIFPDNKGTNSANRKIKPAYSKLNPKYKGLYDEFEARCCLGLKESTVKSYKTKISSFLFELQGKGLDSLSAVNEKDVLVCFVDDGIQKRSGTVCAKIACFFRALSEAGNKHAARILGFIPKMRIARKNIDYLTDEEVAKIRHTLEDDTSNLSYKDRAVGRLLIYTGIRGIDIACMKIDDIDWENDLLRFEQQKTSQPLQLPLIPVVGNAIYDYYTMERPVSESPYLFLSPLAPHNSLTTDGIAYSVQKVMSAADIRQAKGRRKGTHIFRHHMAITMLANGVPQPVITGTMGHTVPESLSPYLHADMKHLRECALSLDRFPFSEEVLQSCLK